MRASRRREFLQATYFITPETLPDPPARSVRVHNYTQYSDWPLETVIKEHGTEIFNVYRM